MHLNSELRSGKELILATKTYAFDDLAKSWWSLISTFVLWITAIAGTLSEIHLLYKIVCSILAGLLLLRLFVIYHDQQHHAILPNSKLADVLMRLFGIFALSPSSIWRSSHNHHHRHNSKMRGSHIGSFPVMTKDRFLKSSRADRFVYLFSRHPLTIATGYVWVFLIGMCIRPFLSKPKEHLDALLALVLHAATAVGLIYFFGWQTWILAQIVPRLITYGLGSYLFYTQHNYPGVTFYEADGWTYEKAALDSSSYMKTGPIMAWFTGNIGYHHIHHLNAKIPFYRLPEVQLAFPELQNPQTTSLSPVDIVRCLRLKVWDTEYQRMVGL